MHHRRSSPHRLEQSTKYLLKAVGSCDVKLRERTWELCSKGPWRPCLTGLLNWLQKHWTAMIHLICLIWFANLSRFTTMHWCSLPFSGHVTLIWKKHESEAKPSETSHIYLVTTACLEQCDMADGKARRSFSIKDDRSRSLSLWILKGIHQLSKWERQSWAVSVQNMKTVTADSFQVWPTGGTKLETVGQSLTLAITCGDQGITSERYWKWHNIIDIT